MPDFMANAESIAALHQSVIFRVEALVDQDGFRVHPDRANDVRLFVQFWDAQGRVQISEPKAKCKMVGCDFRDRDRRRNQLACRIFVLGKQLFGVSFDLVLRKKWDLDCHLLSSSSAS